MDTVPERKIIHIDMDAFFASCEQRERPELKGRPVVVGGDPRSRGVVAAASYEARRFGVRSAMSCAKAYRLCPQAVFVPPSFELYRKISDEIHDLFLGVTPLVEPLSLDEAYLDVTENLLKEPLARNIALHLKNAIRERTGLSASAGVGPNKFIAKVASDLRKPDGLVVVAPCQVPKFLERLPVERFWGVGPATAKKLHQMGLRNAADLRKCPEHELEAAFGKFGTFLHGLAFGQDSRPVEPIWEPKSRGAETTFARDIVDVPLLKEALHSQAQEVSGSLDEIRCLARTVTLKLRYSDFTTITRSRTLFRPSNRWQEFLNVAEELLTQSTEAGLRPVRLIGLSLSGLIRPDEPLQLWFDLPL